jgi:hypothetical protein
MEREERLYHPIAAQAIAERRKTPKSCVTPPDIRRGSFSPRRQIVRADATERGHSDEKPVHGWQTL